LDLEYPLEEVPRQTSSERLLVEEEALVEDHQIYLPEEEILQIQTTDHQLEDPLEEGEILEQLEEGEIPNDLPIS
jgi:hypothetical protein